MSENENKELDLAVVDEQVEETVQLTETDESVVDNNEEKLEVKPEPKKTTIGGQAFHRVREHLILREFLLLEVV